MSEIYEKYFMKIIEEVSYYQLHMTLSNFFVRGGWDFGLLYMDENIIYGDSLIYAHEIESNKNIAIYPRIVIGNRINEMVKRMIYNKEVLLPFPYNKQFEIDGNATLPYVLKDENDLYFINYLYAALDSNENSLDISIIYKHKEIITAKTNQFCDDKKVLKKYCWSAFYHNRFCNLFLKSKLGLDNVDDCLIDSIPLLQDEWQINWILLDDFYDRNDI